MLTNEKLWNIADSIVEKTIGLDKVGAFEFLPDGVHVVALLADTAHPVGIFNIQSNEWEYTYEHHPSPLTCLAVAPDGKHFATGANGMVTIWKAPENLASGMVAEFVVPLEKWKTEAERDVEFINTNRQSKCRRSE